MGKASHGWRGKRRDRSPENAAGRLETDMVDIARAQDASTGTIATDATSPLRIEMEDVPTGRIAIATLARPDRRNALSMATLAAMEALIADLRDSRDIQAVVIAAEGPVFSAGHDLKELTTRRADADAGRAFFEETLGLCARVMQGLVTLPQPVIAAVEGIATAAGCQLVATCDLAIAGDGARFCTPGVHIGLFCSTPMVALSRNVSPKHAMEMLLLGEMVPATDAARMGLVNRVVPAGHALAAALDWARIIAQKSPATLALGKRTFGEQLAMPLDAAYAHATRIMVENMLAGSACEGIDAFLARRAPVWPA
jgi:enoyl-CoA hydratase/carnithine racemase